MLGWKNAKHTKEYCCILFPSIETYLSGDQMRVQGEQMRTYAEQVRDLVRGIQMSGLQISLPAPDLAPPLTSEPLRPDDTQ
ncbi:hypothetical protein D8674_020393 [Pyrus ussuriensis x Pyrus communis]|uniref:Uncharacterized protein n=1 Tax=Pyrus ussuriensis x Pyrus communis TaxID=2448454 RepID=A0A5N5HFY5_9ROSA|nr:hypothetical protein D8674_020393 [Pyrus ussuriensis x Pyrus communis]